MSTQSHNVKITAEISATSKGLVDALNQASSAVNSTSSNWKSKFDKLKDSTSVISQGVKNLGDLFKNMGDIDPSSMSTLTNAIGEVSTNFDKVKGEVDAFVQKLSELKIAASNLGMPIEEYQAFDDAVKASGVDFTEASNMLASMQQQILNLANGVPEAQSLFDRLGVTLEQVSSNTVGANFQLLVNALNDTIPASERATQNMQLFKSSIDNTLQVAQQYQKTVSEQTNAYATDKDVQNAISLSSAIEKLGKQLEGYASGASNASVASNQFNRELDLMVDDSKNLYQSLMNLAKAYGQYVDSVGKTTTNPATIFKDVLSRMDAVQQRWDMVKGVATGIDFATEIQRYEDDMISFMGFLDSTKNKISKEVDDIAESLKTKLSGDLPIDTKEIDTAVEDLEKFLSIWKKVQASVESQKGWLSRNMFTPQDSNIDFLVESLESLKIPDAFKDDISNIREHLFDLQSAAKGLNADFDFSQPNNQIAEFDKLIADAFDKIKRGEKVRINTDDVDKAIKKLKEVKDKLNESRFSGDKDLLFNERMGKAATSLQGYMDNLAGIKKQMEFVNLLADKNVSRWGRIKNAIKSGWNYLTHFRSGLGEANGSAETLGTTFAKGIGQMLGMGSAVAVVTTAMRNLVKLAKEYVKSLQEANKELTYGDLGGNAESMSSARDKNDKRNEELISKLKEYSDLVKEERSSPSNEAMAKRRNLQDELNKLYGMRLNADNRGDIDAQIGRELDKLTRARIKAIDAQIKANQKVSDGVDKFIDSFDGIDELGDMLNKKDWMGYLKQIGYTFTGDINGANAIKEAQERSTKAKEETNALMEQRRRLEREDLRKQFDRMNNAKEADKAEKERKEANEKATTALEEANKKLDEWQNSLTDTDRQKNLREIMAKYEDAVREGVDLEEARNVAVLAIAKMLQKEREDEDKKNKELLKAVEERIKAYKDAYKAYVEADKAVTDAKKDYARTQKELADEAKSERIAKRRERLQKAMGRFGFSLYEGFSLNESSSERRERRRNAQLDASISEKMARSQAGDRVHFTHAEKERLQAFEKLQKQDKRLESAQKAMEAADKQKKAAEQLQEAAKAIKEAIYGRSEAGKDLKDAGKNLKEANSKRRKRGQEDSPEMIFDNARKSLNARGVSSSYSTKTIDYSTQLGTLHTDLQKIMQKTYLVR